MKFFICYRLFLTGIFIIFPAFYSYSASVLPDDRQWDFSSVASCAEQEFLAQFQAQNAWSEKASPLLHDIKSGDERPITRLWATFWMPTPDERFALLLLNLTQKFNGPSCILLGHLYRKGKQPDSMKKDPNRESYWFNQAKQDARTIAEAKILLGEAPPPVKNY
jgi:hypothetical protein